MIENKIIGFSSPEVAVKKLTSILVILFCTGILSIIHIHNGFPLLLADSTGYIYRGLSLKESSHWSNTYSIFIACIYGLFGTLQMVAIIQNLIAVTTLYIFSQYVIKPFTNIKFIFISFILVFTSLPWISTMIMSDIFTPISFLILLLLFFKSVSTNHKLVLFPILFIGMSAHQSHLLILPIFIFCLIMTMLILNKNRLQILKPLFWVTIMFVSSFFFEKNIMNTIANQSKQISHAKAKRTDIFSGYYFLAVRMYESKQLDKLLEKFCKSNDYNYLCDDNITPENEIRVKNVTYSKRHEKNNLYQKYSTDNKEFSMFCLKQPRFYYGCLLLVLKKGYALLINSEIRNYAKLRSNNNVDPFLKKFTDINPSDLASYKNSKQIKLYYPTFIKKYIPRIMALWWLVILPVLLIITIFSFSQSNKKSILEFDCFTPILFIILAHVINCIICSVFSNYENVRYSSRTLWLMNFGILILFHWMFTHRKRKALDSN